MITSVHVENFRSLKSVTLRLSPLTVLVGPNASGKTTFLDLFRVGRSITKDDSWQKRRSPIALIVERQDGNALHHNIGIGTQVDAAWFGIGMTQSLRLDLAKMRHPNVVTAAQKLDSDGGNLTNLFASLTRKQQTAVAAQLEDLVPMFSDVEATPSQQQGSHNLRFQDRWNEDVWYAPHEVSDGTMLLLAFLLLQYQPQVPDLITIEEPERGFHPYLLGQLVDYLRKLTRGELGKKPIQVLMATHSADLLDHLQPDEVRFLSRNKTDGSVQVSEVPTGTEDWEEARREYRDSLGEIWLAGGLGGVPG